VPISAAPAAVLAWVAAAFAACAACAASPAFWSTSVMRPSFLRVRSCVSSSDRLVASTLEFTSPTLVRTNFFEAQAVEPPATITAIGTANRNFRMI